MKLDKKQFSSGIVGAVIGACSVAGINALDSATHKSKASVYESIEAVEDGRMPRGQVSDTSHRTGVPLYGWCTRYNVYAPTGVTHEEDAKVENLEVMRP